MSYFYSHKDLKNFTSCS